MVNRISPVIREAVLWNSHSAPNVAKEIEKPSEPRMDLVELSEKLKEQAPTKGIVNTHTDANAGATPVSKIVITTIGVNRLYPTQCEMNADRGFVDDYFFHLDDKFIKEQAENIANGGRYDSDDLGSSLFLLGIREWFSESDNASLNNSLRSVIAEYAGRLKSGETEIDLHSLKSTFQIQGENVTLGALLDMRDTAQKLSGLSSGIGGVGWGTEQFFTYAQKGVLRAAASQYAKTLPGALGVAFEKNFSALWENNLSVCKDGWTSSSSGTTSKYKSWITNASNYTYDLFSGLDFSSKSAAQADYSKKSNLFHQMLTIGDYKWSSKDINYFKAKVSEAFNTATSAIWG